MVCRQKPLGSQPWLHLIQRCCESAQTWGYYNSKKGFWLGFLKISPPSPSKHPSNCPKVNFTKAHLDILETSANLGHFTMRDFILLQHRYFLFLSLVKMCVPSVLQQTEKQYRFIHSIFFYQTWVVSQPLLLSAGWNDSRSDGGRAK